MAIKTHKKTNKMFLQFSYTCIIQKTLTKMDLCSERTLSFHTLNEHILLVKRDSEMSRFLAKVLLQAHMKVSKAKILNLSPANTILTGF